MPLGLLLQQVFHAFGEGLDRLDPWNRLVATELVLLDRARSAFLARWFGPHIPLQGQHLRIAIVNLEALRARYQDVNRAAAAAPSGLNLTEPLAGLAGQIAGAVLSPSGVLLLGALAVRRIHSWIGQLGGALATIVAAGVVPAVAGALGLLALPFALVGAVLVGGVNQAETRAVYDLLGALAEMLEALRRFVGQLLGPREQVRNPLVRAFLEIVDRLAVLLPFVIALVAIIFARVGPLLRPLATQVVRLRALAEAVIGAVVFIFQDWLLRLTALYKDTSPTMELEEELGARGATTSGPVSAVYGVFQRLVGGLGELLQRNPSPWTILKGVFRSLEAISTVLVRGLGAVFGQVQREFSRIGDAMKRLVDAWLPLVDAAVRAAVLDHPAAQGLIAGREAMTTIAAAFRRVAAAPAPAAPTPPAGSSAPFGSSIPFLSPPPEPHFRAPNAAAIARGSGPASLLDLDSATVTEVASGIEEALRGPIEFRGRTVHPFSYDTDTLGAIARMERVPSVFTAERLALRDAQGRTPAEQLAAARAEEVPLRDALLAVVGRVLPPAVGQYLPQLDGVFRALEARLYPESPEPEAAHPAGALPVRALPENDRLQPVVHRLRIVGAGFDSAETGTWGERLRQALLTQSYLASSAGAAAPAGT